MIKSMSREIYKIIKRDIINFKMLPGQILMVQQLAIEYNVSRTPVREALVRLKEEGFVKETQGRKFKVAEVTWKQISDLYQIRKIIESYVVLTSMENINKPQIQYLKSINDCMEKCLFDSDYSSFFDKDFLFHNYILELYGNEMIIEWMRNIQDHQQRIRNITINIEGRLEDTIKEHKNIIEYLELRQFEEASKVLINHLDTVVNDMMKLSCESPYILSSLIK